MGGRRMALAVVGCLCACSSTSSSTLTTGDGGIVRSYGGINYVLHVPAGYHQGTATPLVLMLHGCTQSAPDFEAGTQMDKQGDAGGFLVAYPDQPTSANAAKCWNWFVPGDQARGSGEPSVLAGIVGDVAKDYTVDPKRVFAAGISAGAAMTVILGATYPDVFAAIGVHSGLEYQAATDTNSALSASAYGGPDPKAQGDAAFAAMGSAAHAVPVMVFHGDADNVVNVVNGQQVIAQWTETDTRAGSTAGPGTSEMGSAGGKTYTHTSYSGGQAGKTLLESYIVHGLEHAWSGGSTSGTYTDPNAPDASAILWSFFAAHGR
ncbi:MAG TPA: PHB depolymerase family esterase [Polyangiaceae bacterium]